MRGTALVLMATLSAGLARAESFPAGLTFRAIEGGTIAMDDWRGQPILVVNTASMCGFADQFVTLQALYDRYRAEGLVVLAVPSDDFAQELGTEAEVKDYCEMVFGIDMPMTAITPVTGQGAHPFYAWLQATEGWEPGWNFNKVLIGADGEVAGTWRAGAAPDGRAITRAVEGALGF
jgi:glutathione peroxidase